MSTDTPTPRTDARCVEPSNAGSTTRCDPNYSGALVSADFARALERELAEAKAELARTATNERAQYDELCEIQHELNEAEITDDPTIEGVRKLLSELAALRRDKERLDWLATQCYLPGEHPDDGLLVIVSEKFAPYGSFTLNEKHDAAVFRAAIDAAQAQEGRT